MFENLTTTQVLAVLIGLYFLAAGIGLLSDRRGMSDMFKELMTSRSLGYLGGFIAFAIGGAIIAVHNNWDSYLAGFVSLVGWAALVEGVLMLACREKFLGMFERLTMSERFVGVVGLLVTALGAVLLLTQLLG